MIWTLIIIWVVGSLAFLGSLAFMASRPMPSFDEAAIDVEAPQTQWESPEEAPALTASEVAVG